MKKPRRKQRGRKPSRLNTHLPNGLANGGPVAPAPEEELGLSAEPIQIELPPEQDFGPQILESGATELVNPDGSVVIDFNPAPAAPQSTGDHYENLAELLDEETLGPIAQELCEGIEADDASRRQWIEDRERGLEMMGFKLEKPKADVGEDGKISTVRHPLLAEAVLRFQANARGELLPASGPVKVRDDGLDTVQTSEQSRKLEDLLNHYLTTTATEYYPDTDRMLLWVGFCGMAFKKVYTCPLRRRPVSESVDAKDLIVSDTVTDLRNAKRVTHRIVMKRSTMKRMQLLGVYRNIDLGEPEQDPDSVDRKIHEMQGTQPYQQRPQDADHELWECYCELDLPGFEHKEVDKITGEEVPTGLPLPYRVTIDKTSRKILEIRRNWAEDDTVDYKAKIPFVPFPFVPGFGFYGLGLLHILGNATAAVTGAWRIMLDAGMLANFPGGFISEQPNRLSDGRTRKHNYRPSLGEFVEIDTGGNPINAVVSPLPYKGPDANTMALTNHIAEYGQRLGGTAEVQVGEGRQDAPVGTTLALIEQAQKIMSAVHKRLHAAQAEEFKLLLDEIKADPECLWRHEPKLQKYWDVNTFLAALDNCSLVPVADPNTPSHMHRIMKAQAVKMLSMGNPLYNPVAVDRYVLQEIGVGDPDQFFMPPQPQPQQPPVDPVKMAEVQNKAAANQIKAMEIEKKYEDKEKDRQLKRNLAVLDLAGDLARNPTSQPIVDRTITRMAPSMARRQSKLGGGAVLARPPPHRPLPGLHGPMMGPTF